MSFSKDTLVFSDASGERYCIRGLPTLKARKYVNMLPYGAMCLSDICFHNQGEREISEKEFLRIIQTR